MGTKITGGVLLIVGTSIGAGMLALPIVTAASGFVASSLMLLVCWTIMTFGAFLLLEVNLWLPPRNNIITMARTTLGRPGEIIAWASYLLLLYSLLSAYISSGSDIFHGFTRILGIHSPVWLDSLVFVFIFGSIVFRGIQPVDYVNRALMITKFGSLFILIFFAMPHVQTGPLLQGQPALLTSTITVMLTSFGFANIIPSLRSYFHDDVKVLRKAVLIGSLIPLCCYLLWDLVILGTLPHATLVAIMQGGGSVTELTQALSQALQNASITGVARIFTTICILTSFLCVALSLSDFLADGLRIEKIGLGNALVNAMTFFPPLAIVIFYPSIFVKALNYAGICCVVLIVLLPALMAWSGRYHKKHLALGHYQVMGGRWAVVLLMIVSFVIIALGIQAAL